MLRRHEHHLVRVIGGGRIRRRQPAVRLIRLVIIPAGEHGGKTLDDRLVVGRHQRALRVHHQRAVRPLAIQADGEQLHDFAGVVFVRVRAGDEAALAVGAHVEIQAHGGREGDVLEQVAEISKRAVQERVVVVAERAAVVLQNAVLRDDHDLVQGERDALPQLIGRGDGLLPPGVVHERTRIRRRGIQARIGQQQGQMIRRRQGDLPVNPTGIARRLHSSDAGGTRAKRRLNQKPRGRVRVGGIIRPSGRRRRRSKNLRTIGGREVAVDLTARIIDAVNVDVGFSLLDDFLDVRHTERPDGHNVPNQAAIGLRRGGVNVEHDGTGEGEVSVVVNVRGHLRRRESAVTVFQNRLQAVGAHA